MRRRVEKGDVLVWTTSKQQQNFKVGDVVKSHIQVQSNPETVEVNKLYHHA